MRLRKKRGRIASNKAEFQISPPFTTFRCHFFDAGNFQLCGYEIISDRVSRPRGLRGWKWQNEKRQLRALIGLKWGRGSLWLRRFYAPCKAMWSGCGHRLWCVVKINFEHGSANQKELKKTETEIEKRQTYRSDGSPNNCLYYTAQAERTHRQQKTITVRIISKVSFGILMFKMNRLNCFLSPSAFSPRFILKLQK